jgi:hypothetical protein
MRSRYSLRVLFVFCSLLVAFGAKAQSTEEARRKPVAWDTCTYVEGKGDSCKADWFKRPVDGFSVNTGLDRLQPKDRFKATWREVGVLGSSRIRRVEYFVNDMPVGAYLLLAERKDGLFAPLLKWNGELPEIEAYRPGRAGVLGFSRNFGGNIPMFRTWAWTSSDAGPVQLDFEQTLRDAIQKISPAHSCYDTKFEWDTLHIQSYCWTGEWPGKPGVKDVIDMWFDFKDGKLVPQKVELRSGEIAPEIKRWP